MAKKLLVTGGAGYIGSHTLVELVAAGYAPVVLDNFSNSDPEVLRRVRELTGVEIPFVLGDIRDQKSLQSIFESATANGDPFQSVIHFAALKAVGESVDNPLRYYDNNVGGTRVLLSAMLAARVNSIIFSSSATVYGEPEFLPYTEQHPQKPTNPYGWTKFMVEQMLADVCEANPTFSAVTLRYFNPIGAHPSGRLGEDPKGLPNNLFPFLTQVAVGKLERLRVFGSDYPTIDGTGVRDYLHVVDLAVGHVKAVKLATEQPGFLPLNLGTGQGTSVLQMVRAFEEASGKAIPVSMLDRRPGDLPQFWADASQAQKVLGWTATRSLSDMCRDGWNWQRQNPNGYGGNTVA